LAVSLVLAVASVRAADEDLVRLPAHLGDSVVDGVVGITADSGDSGDSAVSAVHTTVNSVDGGHLVRQVDSEVSKASKASETSETSETSGDSEHHPHLGDLEEHLAGDLMPAVERESIPKEIANKEARNPGRRSHRQIKSGILNIA
jgi:hypothetical protein